LAKKHDEDEKEDEEDFTKLLVNEFERDATDAF